MKQQAFKVLKENQSLIVFIALMMVFRSAIADWNEVPTGSMKPTIIEGDRLFVNKMAYDLRVPFTTISLVKLSDPERGDIIIFDSKESDKRLVKRVVGVPGDTVQLTNNRLMINGNPLSYELVGSSAETVDAVEDLLGVKYTIRAHKRGTMLSNFSAISIPRGYYLALGDNRDMSADSRVIGLVPRNEIVGRSKQVVLSFNYDNFYIPRKDRFFHTL
ncbi:MAG: signal peptidase I [Cellvibrionaceae bacterium]